MSRHASWPLVRQAALWLGLLLCGYALWRIRILAGDGISRISVFGWLIVGALLIASWVLAVTAWRHYLLAYTDQDPGWRVSMRQMGLLLVGKYVPGGVFGFVARLYDQPAAPRRQLFWAGMAEQAVGVGMSSALGALLLLVAKTQGSAWLWLVMSLPILAISGVWLLHHSTSGLPWLRTHADSKAFPRWATLLPAVVLHLLQLLAWAILIMVLASELYELGSHALLGVAGAFLLAVGAGMLVVFVPGGIGVREAVLVGLASNWLDISQAVFFAALLRLVASFLDIIAGVMATTAGGLRRS